MCASRIPPLEEDDRFELPNHQRTKPSSMLAQGLNGSTVAALDPRLARLLQLMESEPFGRIHDWALAFNLSESHLQHLFKRGTGIRLGQALADKRLRRAAHLLTTTTLSVKEIAGAVGYQHTSSFTRAFERYFKQGPRQFRMQRPA